MLNVVAIDSSNFQYTNAHLATRELELSNGGDEKDKLSRNAIQDGDLIWEAPLLPPWYVPPWNNALLDFFPCDYIELL